MDFISHQLLYWLLYPSKIFLLKTLKYLLTATFNFVYLIKIKN